MKPAFLPAVAFAAAILSTGGAYAAQFTLQPGEPASKDVFVYAFDVPGAFGLPGVPSDRNWDAETPDVGPFGAFLGAARTQPFNDPNAMPPTPAGVPERRHDSNTLVEFDLSGVPVSSSRVKSATLLLTGAGSLGAFDAPNETSPVTIEAKAVLEAWDEQTVTWNSRPDVGIVFDSQVMTSGQQVLSFDVTELAKAWLGNPTANFGIEFSQRDIVALPPASPGERSRFAVGLFASAANTALAGPTLVVSEVPVPAALPLLLGGIAALGYVRRRART